MRQPREDRKNFEGIERERGGKRKESNCAVEHIGKRTKEKKRRPLECTVSYSVRYWKLCPREIMSL